MVIKSGRSTTKAESALASRPDAIGLVDVLKSRENAP
jgi:hypothetical protein